MKEFSIGEIASLMGISKEMVRYYEKNGIITPTRQNNNYRSYSIFDYFELMEATQLSRFGISIKDIKELKNGSFFSDTPGRIVHFISEIEESLRYQTILRKRAEELLKRMETALLNRGNYWVEKIPEYVLIRFMRSDNDYYDIIDNPDLQIFGTSRVCPFVDSLVEFSQEDNLWNLAVESCYCDVLFDCILKKTVIKQESYCLCTIVDMGELGTFNAEIVLDEIDRHLTHTDLKINGNPVGMLIGRGMEKDKYMRLVKIYIPIKQ